MPWTRAEPWYSYERNGIWVLLKSNVLGLWIVLKHVCFIRMNKRFFSFALLPLMQASRVLNFFAFCLSIYNLRKGSWASGVVMKEIRNQARHAFDKPLWLSSYHYKLPCFPKCLLNWYVSRLCMTHITQDFEISVFPVITPSTVPTLESSIRLPLRCLRMSTLIQLEEPYVSAIPRNQNTFHDG